MKLKHQFQDKTGKNPYPYRDQNPLDNLFSWKQQISSDIQ